MAESRDFHSLDSNLETQTEGSRNIGDNNEQMCSNIEQHWNSPSHQRARPPHYRDSPLPFPPQTTHYLSLSPTLAQRVSSKELSNDIWKQAMLNKKNCVNDGNLNTPSTPNNSVEVGVAFLSHPPAGPDMDTSPPVCPSLDITPPIVSGDDRREVPGSPCNYPQNMTFAKRKFNTSNGSDQSSLNRTPVKQLKKRGKLEREFFERGRNEQMDRSLNGTLDISGPSDFEVADRTWMPESEEKKDLDKTWKPGATHSDSDDDYDAEMESTDLRANSLDKTWTFPNVGCYYCDELFNNESEMFEHMIAIHDEDITPAVSMKAPSVCINCSDQNTPMAFCAQKSRCMGDPYLSAPCVHAHKRVRQTRDHAIIFLQNEEDPYVMLENVLDSVYPERASLSKKVVLPDPPQDPNLFVPLRCASSDKLDAEFEDELETIRQKSRKLAEVLNRTTGSENSSESSLSSRSGPSRSGSSTSESSSQNRSVAGRVLTEEILADNLLPIFNVDDVDVKTKVAVVMEMLLQMEAVHPALFCDNRSITGFKNLLMTRQVKFLHKALSSLNQLVDSVGKKGIFFCLVKIKEDLSGGLNIITKPSTRLLCVGSSAFDPTTIKCMASSLLEKMENLIG